MPARTPTEVLQDLLRHDPGRPRITWYDETAGPTAGERIELSAKVLNTWVAKAAHLLVDDLDIAPGNFVRLDLTDHWRSLYWAFALDRIGAVAVTSAAQTETAAATITDTPHGVSNSARVIAVSRGALSRKWNGTPLDHDVVDEALTISAHPDSFDLVDLPTPESPAWCDHHGLSTRADLIRKAKEEIQHRGWPVPTRLGVVLPQEFTGVEHSLLSFWQMALAAWLTSGSVVVTHTSHPSSEESQSRVAQRWIDERVTTFG
ncbi:MAG: TIGR03089 family protein [Actinomycetota bacterium]